LEATRAREDEDAGPANLIIRDGLPCDEENSALVLSPAHTEASTQLTKTPITKPTVAIVLSPTEKQQPSGSDEPNSVSNEKNNSTRNERTQSTSRNNEPPVGTALTKDDTAVHDNEFVQPPVNNHQCEGEEETLAIQPQDSWDQVWDKLEMAGWTHFRIFRSRGETYTRPPWCTSGGPRTFSSLAQVQTYVRDTYDWKWVEPKKKQRTKSSAAAATVQESASRSEEESVAGDSNESESVTSASEKYQFIALWARLKTDGWTVQKAKNPLDDWHYLMPGVERTTIELGTNAFRSPEDVIAYCKRQDGYESLENDSSPPPAQAKGTVRSSHKRRSSLLQHEIPDLEEPSHALKERVATVLPTEASTQLTKTPITKPTVVIVLSPTEKQQPSGSDEPNSVSNEKNNSTRNERTQSTSRNNETPVGTAFTKDEI
jgi:hypothetical protein